jgi:osmotically-inducible protein OsmY
MTTDNADWLNDTLQQAVERELKWDPSITHASIGVSVNKHAVTLTGTVDSLSKRLAAVHAARRVTGVRTIADEIVVHIDGSPARTDTDIAGFVENVFKWNTLIPETVNATVRRGVVTLDGAVKWNFERMAAERVVQDLSGVTHVTNNVTLAPEPSTELIHDHIVTALERDAEIEADSITVSSGGGEVTLGGTVSSWSKRERIESAAWAAPGVTAVHNHITLH